MDLHRVLLSVIASAGAGAIACESPPKLPTHTVVKSFELPVDGATACGVMQASYNTCYGGTRDACARACRDPSVTYCVLPSEYEKRYDAQSRDAGASCPELAEVPITCKVITPVEDDAHAYFWGAGLWRSGCPIPGRRPDGLVAVDDGTEARDLDERPERERSLGAYLARCAHFEAASVIAFQQLATELRALGVPDVLLADVARAELDEARHASIVRTLAERFGGEVPAVALERKQARSLRAIAIDNVIEGVVGETFGAALALWQAHHATDPSIRCAMAEIAVDECRHAELSLRIDAWAKGRLPDGSLDGLREKALAALVENAAREQTELCARAGLPDVRARVAIARGVASALAA